jgi:hypothetical protein
MHRKSPVLYNNITDAQTVLAEKRGLLTQAQKLTKSRRKSLLSFLHFVSVFALSHSLCSHLATTLESKKDDDKGQKLPSTVNLPQGGPPAWTLFQSRLK